MTMNSNNRALTVSHAIYGRLLRAYPPAHREEFGPAMAQLFRDQCRDAWNEARGWGVAKLWLRVLPDLVKTSIIERLAATTERKSMADKINSLVQPRLIFRNVFVVVFLITVLVAVAVTYILPETYASTATIKVASDQPTTNYDPYFIQTQFEIMKSLLVLQPVIDKLKLNDVWGKKYFKGEQLKTTETMEILKGRMSLRPLRNTQLVAITVYGEDKHEVALIANAVAESYRDYRIKIRLELQVTGAGVLQKQFQAEEESIRQVQSETASLRQQLKIASDAVTIQSPSEQPYWDKKRLLDQLTKAHELLATKIAAVKLDALIPTTTIVQITDTAEPGRAPVKPNKTVNITLGVVFGIILAAIVGGVAAFIALRFRKQVGQTSVAGGSGTSGVSAITLNDGTVGKKIIGGIVYGIAAITVLAGSILIVFGSVRLGNLLIGLSIALTLSIAIRLGHLKRW